MIRPAAWTAAINGYDRGMPTVRACGHRGLARAAASDGGPVRGVVPGPHPVVGPMLESEIRILDRDTFCATDPGLLDPVRILPNPGFL
jgi:hypothetical protein